MARRQPPEGTQAALRAIRLLKAFSESRPEMSLGELCSSVKLTKTTAYRLLAALESEDLVQRNSNTGAYRLGAATLALGVQALRSNDLRSRARRALEKLASESGETATLEVPVDGDMLIVDEVGGPRLVSASVNVGTRWPLHATSSGKALLAFSEDARRWVEGPLKSYASRTITDATQLEASYAGIRERGYAMAVEELEDGYAAVAAPIIGPLGDVEGLLSIGGPVSRLNADKRKRLGEAVRDAARQLSLSPGSLQPQRRPAAHA